MMRPPNAQEVLDIIQTTSLKRIRASFSDNVPGDIKRGLDLLHEVCVKVCKKIVETPDSFQKTEFILFDELAEEILQKLQFLSMPDVERNIHLGHFSSMLIKIAVLTNEDEVKMLNRIFYLRFFVRKIGDYLAYHRKEKRGDVWEELFSNYGLISGLNLSDISSGNEEKRKAYLKLSSFIVFDYYYGLLRNQIEDLTLDKFYGDTDGDSYGGFIGGIFIPSTPIMFRYKCFVVFAAHSFLFYLAERAPDDRIEKGERDFASKVLRNDKVKSQCYRFLQLMDTYTNMLDVQMCSDLEAFLHGYELYSNKNILHEALCEKTARDFFMFVTVYVALNQHDSERRIQILEHALDVEKYQIYVSDGAESHTKELFAEFLEVTEDISYKNMVSCVPVNKEVPASEQTEPEEDAFQGNSCQIQKPSHEDQASKMYELLSKWLKGVLKAEVIQDAKKKQIDYKNADISKLERLINQRVEERLKKDFEPILEISMSPIMGDVPSYASSFAPIKLKGDLLVVSTFTELIESTFAMDAFIPSVSVNFLHILFNELKSKNVLNFFERDSIDYNNDSKYQELLSSPDIYILIGSERLLRLWNYHQADIFQSLIKDKKVCYIPAANIALALNKNAINVKITEITTTIRFPEWEDIEGGLVDGITPIADSTLYSYLIYDGMSIEFTKDELIHYLENNRKIIRVFIRAEIELKNSNVGTALISKERAI